jgi:hypothetical protein
MLDRPFEMTLSLARRSVFHDDSDVALVWITLMLIYGPRRPTVCPTGPQAVWVAAMGLPRMELCLTRPRYGNYIR